MLTVFAIAVSITLLLGDCARTAVAMPQLLRIGPQGLSMRGIHLHVGLGDVRHHGFGVFRIEPGVTINDVEATGLRPCPILRSKAGPLRIARSSSPGASIRETTWNPSAKPTQSKA